MSLRAEQASVAFQLFRYLTFSSPQPQSYFFFLFRISVISFSSACPFVLPRLYLPAVYLTSFLSHPLLSGCHGEAAALQVCVFMHLCVCVCVCVAPNPLSESVTMLVEQMLPANQMSLLRRPCLMGLVILVICN